MNYKISKSSWTPAGEFESQAGPGGSPAFRTFGGGALSAFQKVAPDAVPFGPGLPQGHGGWNQGAGARSNRPLDAVAGARPLCAGGSALAKPTWMRGRGQRGYLPGTRYRERKIAP